ncbi:MAG TPA: hypothetical protein VH482_02820 [Thermomicrobiales bacterium]|jgi:hypothetical protein
MAFQIEHPDGRRFQLDSLERFLMDYGPYGFTISVDQPAGCQAPTPEELAAVIEATDALRHRVRVRAAAQRATAGNGKVPGGIVMVDGGDAGGAS